MMVDGIINKYKVTQNKESRGIDLLSIIPYNNIETNRIIFVRDRSTFT